ncbi:caspase-1 [Dendroctonus ponderosae]|uniref:Caspase family p20 domain-containing protein n=1 Tax=Dendroctonus ponderosae TaxID=77166 RepID=A0AAR5QBR2_DENPD|nr:caspase-1 [Dendroctonus ponderosae]KAH1003513.1 hypothetical protein HUJ04_003432 [Dendroctonus ponderosae]KAH1010084.1 hypothetical protein HUJ05_004439 [Dendroctonus ponderosae]
MGNCLEQFKKSPSGNIEDSSDEHNDDLENSNSLLIFPTEHSRYDTHYKMNGKLRGLTLIFNHENFDNEDLAPRKGTERDVEKIANTFRALGFQIHCYNDLTLNELRDLIQDYVKQDYYHNLRDCLVIFILTHGHNDDLWAKDTTYDPQVEIVENFTNDKCPSFAGKPKLIFIQACKGEIVQRGVKLQMRPNRTSFDGLTFYEYPTHADFLIVHATSKKHYAFRNEEKGSFFVTVLCEELSQRHQNTDLLAILIGVNRRMAIEFSSSNSDITKHGGKQAPYFESSLTRLILFGHGSNSPDN